MKYYKEHRFSPEIYWFLWKKCNGILSCPSYPALFNYTLELKVNCFEYFSATFTDHSFGSCNIYLYPFAYSQSSIWLVMVLCPKGKGQGSTILELRIASNYPPVWVTLALFCPTPQGFSFYCQKNIFQINLSLFPKMNDSKLFEKPPTGAEGEKFCWGTSFFGQNKSRLTTLWSIGICQWKFALHI